MKRSMFLVVLAAAVAGRCASTSQSPAPSPSVTIKQVSSIAPLRMRIDGGLPVVYEVQVTNPFDHAVTLASIELETVGDSGAYVLKRVRHAFTRAIAPHSSETVALRVWIQPMQESDLGDVKSPAMLRGTAHFNSAAGPSQIAFSARVQ